ncbi:unnamed protein product [Closterium sp. NIES-53]
MNIQHMLVQRGNSSSAASTLTTVKTSGVRRQRKVKNEPSAERRVQAAASGITVSGSATPPPPDDIVSHLRKPTYQRDFQTLVLYGPHGVGCQLTAQDALTLADGECLADTVVDFHNMMVLILHIAQMPTADRKKAANSLDRAEITIMDGVEVPLQPLPQLGEFGALVFPKEDEVRTNLARQSGMVTRMNLGGYVVCAAVTSLARTCGILEEQLLSGAAHELQTYGTPLLSLSTSHNQVDHAASMKTLASSIHATPCPLPVPSSFRPKVDVASPDQWPESPPQAVPTKEESENPTTPVTPEAPGRPCRTRMASTRLGGMEESRTVRNISMQSANGNRPASSRWTGVSWCPCGRNGGVKMVCGPGTGQQIRLGVYNVEDDAAYAYDAAAYVIRRKDHISHMKVLTDTEMATLDGCVRSDVRHLVKARLWWRWRQWRTTIAEVGIAPGTPFPLENGGSRSPPISIGDVEGEYPLTLKDDAADEEMQELDLG